MTCCLFSCCFWPMNDVLNGEKLRILSASRSRTRQFNDLFEWRRRSEGANRQDSEIPDGTGLAEAYEAIDRHINVGNSRFNADEDIVS